MTDDRLQQLERELELIKQRNASVEANKAWETSGFRIGTICAFTYVVTGAVLFAIGAERFWWGALVPVVGFLLSTQSLPMVKRWWINHRYNSSGGK